MRKVLYRICLLINTHQIVRHHFISNRNGGEESKIVERQRECVRERQHVGGEFSETFNSQDILVLKTF
jgi:hypothetical protein